MKNKKPKIYLTNWASHKSNGCHGPGRLLSIMVRTSHFANPDGVVPLLTPRAKDLYNYRSGEIDIKKYRENYFKQIIEKKNLAPGKLMWESFSFFEQENKQPVENGDTLCCACSREKSLNGECHRAWAAVLLQDAGWEVILDGKKLKEVDGSLPW